MPRCASFQVFNDMTVAELKEECRTRGMKVSGVKRELVDRLVKESKKRRVVPRGKAQYQAQTMPTVAVAVIAEKEPSSAHPEDATMVNEAASTTLTMQDIAEDVASTIIPVEAATLEATASQAPASTAEDAQDVVDQSSDVAAEASLSAGTQELIIPQGMQQQETVAEPEAIDSDAAALMESTADSTPVAQHSEAQLAACFKPKLDSDDAPKPAQFKQAPLESLLVAPSPARQRLLAANLSCAPKASDVPQSSIGTQGAETVAESILGSLKTPEVIESLTTATEACPSTRAGIGCLPKDTAEQRDTFWGGHSKFEHKPFYENMYTRLQAKSRGETPSSPVREKPTAAPPCSTPQRQFANATPKPAAVPSPGPSSRSGTVAMLSPAQFAQVLSPRPCPRPSPRPSPCPSPRSHIPAQTPEARAAAMRRQMLEKLSEQMQVCLRKLRNPSMDDAYREKVQELIRSIKTRMDEVTVSRAPASSPAVKRVR